MSAPSERTIRVNGLPCRVWEKGEGAPVGVLAGLGGLPRWSPFLDRLAAQRRVIVPSLPGFPGAEGHDRLDSLADWIAATLDLLEGAGVRGADLVGCSVGGTLAAEAAIFSRGFRRLVLLAPFGLFDPAQPPADPWAMRPGPPRHLANDLQRIGERFMPAPGAGIDTVEWQVTTARASEAAARLLWPTTDTGIRRRLHRVAVPTLVLWGADDRLLPVGYAKLFAEALGGPSEVRVIPGAGHLAELDAPDACAEAVLAFLGQA
jgi:pimeloyl-ACP methyl ester carboxylesterase